MKYPYIKPTRYVHDSGFRCFETGYCEIEGARAVNIETLGRCTDHFWIMNLMDSLTATRGPGDHRTLRDINMDLTKNGYIRMFSNEEGMKLRWDGPPGFALSTMRLEVVPLTEAELESRRGNEPPERSDGFEF